MIHTHIQWTDATVNFWIGCPKFSDGCKFCYMHRIMERKGRNASTVIRVNDKTISKILKELTMPSRIFTCSMSDFFVEGADQLRDKAWDTIRKNPQHQWQILTKRHERILPCLPDDWGQGWDHVWLGVSVESEKYMQRAETLAAIPAKTRFISFEPLLEEIDLTPYKLMLEKYHWGIIGGESGNDVGKHRYRPCDFKWMEKIITDLQGADVKVFVKQMGTFIAAEMGYNDRHGGEMDEWPSNLQIRDFPVGK